MLVAEGSPNPSAFQQNCLKTITGLQRLLHNYHFRKKLLIIFFYKHSKPFFHGKNSEIVFHFEFSHEKLE